MRLLRRRPRVSVVIASYQWPEALQVSLAGALAQTVEELEVLVIEDGPDPASRAVVSEANDSRVQWMCLRESTGSQSGPNAHGWRRARAPIVAYLGHDDVWHPEHLARLLSVLDPTVDVAHAVTLLLSFYDDKRVVVAGSRPWEPTAFVPPSSVAHWRDSPRIGEWLAPDRSPTPVDHAFLTTSHARGARFVTSGEPTVFKYPATWRLDSYRTRDVTAQLRLRERLRSDPQLGHQLLREAFAAGAPGVFAAPSSALPGVNADYNRRMKGLSARFAPPMTRWRPGESLPFPGWHAAERDEVGSYAWTGPYERAFVRLDAPGDGELGVRVVVRHVVSGEQLDRLAVDLDGTAVAMERTQGPDEATVLTGWLGRRAHDRTVEVGITTAVLQPRASDPESEDERPLGAGVSEIELLDRAPDHQV